MNNTGDIIKERRKEKGISVQKLSELSGLARSTIYRLENGEIQNLNLKNAAKILEPLDLSIDELIDEDDLENIEDKADFKQIELDKKIKDLWNNYTILSGHSGVGKSHLLSDYWVIDNNGNTILDFADNSKKLNDIYKALNEEGRRKLLERAEELQMMGYVKEGDVDDD